MARIDPQMRIRVPVEAKDYIARQARRNGSSQTSEIIRCIIEKMDRDAAAQAVGKTVAKQTA